MPRMNTEIARLEELLDQLLDLHEAGRGQLRVARARISALEAENRALGEKLNGAISRLEGLLEKLPEPEEE